MSVEFRNPPLHGRGTKGNWSQILEEVFEQPRRWAMVRTTGTANAAGVMCYALRRRKVRYQAGRWEFRSHATAEGSGEVFARYLGPDGDD